MNANCDDMSPQQVAEITAYVDIEAPPTGPTAHIIFGTNQSIPARIVAARYHEGLAPLIVTTGGINRHNSVVEGREFRRLLLENGVPDSTVRVEDESANTWQNVERALPFLKEATASGLSITAVAKWYHRRTIHILRTVLPEVDVFYAITWEPVYDNASITRINWQQSAEGKRRVIREHEEVSRRVKDGSFATSTRAGGGWR